MLSASDVVNAPDPTPAVLVARATAGDRAAEAELCRRFAPAARTFARRRLRGSDAVEEFAQDVLLRLVQALREGAVDDPPRVGGFVLGICRNLSRERARTQERRSALWEQFGEVVEVMRQDAPAHSPKEVAHLEDCLTQMTERTRLVLRRTVVEGASAAEVAAELSLTEGNVRVVRHRALEALRKCLQGRLTWEAS